MFYKTVLQLAFCLVIGLSVVFAAPSLTNTTTPTLPINGSEFGVQKVNVGNYYYYLCSPNPCQNGGYCTTNGYTFSCSCQYGFSGLYCQTYTLASNCLYNQCPGGSVCSLQSNGFYSCQCPHGYYGPLCQSAYYVCNPNPCYNGGICSQTSATTAVCQCQIGFSGDLCQFSSNPCNANPCQNGGICTPLFNGNQNLYTCTCLNGFAGVNCESIYNPCFTNGFPNCQNNGICTVNYAHHPYYQCSCQNGFSGTSCQIAPYIPINNCVDIDHVNCPKYALSNYCNNIYSINGITIPNYCAKSCGTCKVNQCLDTSASCALWKSLDYCNLYPVNIYCRNTCSLC